MKILSKEEKKELWKIKCEYRLKNPLFNLFYKSDPLTYGLTYGFISLFFFSLILTFLPGIKDPIGPKVLISAVLFGSVIYIIAHFENKAWKKHKDLIMPDAKYQDVHEFDVKYL